MTAERGVDLGAYTERARHARAPLPEGYINVVGMLVEVEGVVTADRRSARGHAHDRALELGADCGGRVLAAPLRIDGWDRFGRAVQAS